MTAKLICLLVGHNWTQWARARSKFHHRCHCKRCGKVWTI